MGGVLEIPRKIIGNSSQVEDPDDYYVPCFKQQAYTYNSRHPTRIPILNDFMKALADPSIHIIGIWGSNDQIQDSLIPKLGRRIERDKVFDVVLTAYVGNKVGVKKMQDEIAGQLGFSFSKKSEGERAHELLDRIKKEKKVLIVLFDLHKGLDLGEIGIPFGENHRGCKILLSTSIVEMYVSKEMNTQRDFIV